MISKPEQIKKRQDNYLYEQQTYDLERRIYIAIRQKENHVTVPYHLCPKLIDELKKQGYYVKEKSNFFWGNETIVEWK